MTLVPYVLEVGGQEVVLTPDPAHEFTATSEQVALGYGVSASTIRDHKANRPEELVEGKHWVVGVIDTPGGQQNLTLWTKRGIVRLGFFIRSKRARLFRDMAEDLVIGVMRPNQPASSPALINCHGVAQAFGITRTAAQLKIKRAHLQPVAHYVDVCPGYLYRLADVQAEWPEITFQPFSGEVREGLKPVQRPLERRAQRQPMPRLLDSQPVTDRVQAAQELVQLEQRRAYLLGVLA